MMLNAGTDRKRVGGDFNDDHVVITFLVLKPKSSDSQNGVFITLKGL